ncbi:enoyl-CoA hydratase/isomerase family protein [Chitinimonas koreensis]|uniref:enoyl-CoA hydratase/isomerase family protein n=1 Tax=Chitinimonas koreensis TaxID=356302 RepID=UPI00041FF7E7|nr:enoyl-CoA hydratase/isomerase family protein [Chitinimonas koreensis]QNM94753.1 enoyl-CoA hydratase/isomerase family protein [Chitinimonas koreensis]
MTQSVLFALHPAAGGRQVAVATLNAEKSLNALSLDMIRLLAPQLAAWRDDPAVACVLLCGAGEKAFCAGGDVVTLYHAIRDRDYAVTDAFFAEEYALDYAIHTYPKPILAWGQGIVMGGGLGLMAGASHRVATERTRIAMPEITIGLYPDVGGSWFLNRLPGRLGIYLGLTGASLNAADARYLGLADFVLPSALRGGLLEGLAGLAWHGEGEADKRLLSSHLRELSRATVPELAPSPVRAHFDAIQSLTDYDSLDEMVAAISHYEGSDDWLRSGAQKLAAGSPTSMRLIVEAQRRARQLSLREVFEMELTLSRQCCRHPDFAEGVRALLVDKDGAPRWTPATLAEVSPELIDGFFAAP